MTYLCLREYFSLGNAIYKSQRWSRTKVHVNGRSICKRLLHKRETVPFTRVNVAALLARGITAHIHDEGACLKLIGLLSH